MGMFQANYDQVLAIYQGLYPLVIGSDDWRKLPEDERAEIRRTLALMARAINGVDSKAGMRKAFDDTVYAAHKVGQLLDVEPIKPEPDENGGKRGRKPLTAEEKAARDLALITADL